MDIIIKGSDAILAGEFIEPDIVFDCGQCFRFTKREDIWTGVAHGRVLNVQKTEEGLRLIGGAADAESIWRGYFDADTSYADILTEISADDTVRSAAADFKGMRLLRQQPFETLISFIISANNNIKRISKIIEAVCALAGEEIAEGKYAFPTPEALAALSEEQLTACGAGYRAPYIKKTATAVAEGLDIESLRSMDYLEAKKALIALPGVGPKVADCILLFSLDHTCAFPQDVWIKRALKDIYGVAFKNDKELVAFAAEKFGRYAGIAQQYIFHYARTHAEEAK